MNHQPARIYPTLSLFILNNGQVKFPFHGFETHFRYNFHFNLRGRKWISPEGKTVYFNTIEVWRVETAEEVQDTDITPEQAVGTPPQTSQLTDDLPF